MRILLVKTSSLGDVIHNLPVVSDIRRHFPQATIDWCVEDAFAGIPQLHPAVSRIVPVAIRRWRKALGQGATWQDIGASRRILREYRYDRVIDTQGLIKSALCALLARGPCAGYTPDSAREPLASVIYGRRYSVPRQLHAVVRNRLLVAAALGYPLDTPLDYGITAAPADFDWLEADAYVVLLTATSRDDKLWPEGHWIELGRHLGGRGIRVVLPAGSPAERERAARLAAAIPHAVAAPPLNLAALAALLGGARGVVGVDTGLTHLAVALATPTVAIYTATEPGLTGVLGSAFHRNLGGRAQCPDVGAVYAELEAGLR